MGIAPVEGGDAADANRIGVFGGTFDPVHVGHVQIAEAVRRAIGLELVLFVPAARPRLRTVSPVASIDDRVAMVRLAIGPLRWARLSMVDAARPGPAYSIDTIDDVRRELGPGPELYLVVGADSLATLPDWKDADRLVTMARLVCVGRPGAARPADLPPGHPGRGAVFVDGPMVDVSATEIRRRVRAGKPIAGMVHEGVERYIRERRLYA